MLLTRLTSTPKNRRLLILTVSLFLSISMGNTLAVQNELIQDDGDNGTSSTQGWSTIRSAAFFNGDAKVTSKKGAKYYYQTMLTPGTYTVYMKWAAASHPLQHEANVKVTHKSGEATLQVDQTAHGNQWNLLGRWQFQNAAKIAVTNPGLATTSVDALKFVPVASMSQSQTVSAAPINDVNFETGTYFGTVARSCGLLGAVYEDYSACDARMTVVTSPVRDGKFAGRFTVLGSDPGFHPHHRANAVIGGTDGARIGTEQWYGFSSLIPGDWVSDPAWVVLTDWHSTSDLAQSLQIELDGSNLIIQSFSGSITEPHIIHYQLPSFLETYRASWVDWVVHAKWSLGEDGFIHVWMNGTQVVNYKGRTLPVGSIAAPYWKIGPTYPVFDTTSHTVYYDEIRVGDKNAVYATVAPQ